MAHATDFQVTDAMREVFDLLKVKGPLCPTQISIELLTPLETVQALLRDMKEGGLVEERPDRDKTRRYDDEFAPWGLSRTP